MLLQALKLFCFPNLPIFTEQTIIGIIAYRVTLHISASLLKLFVLVNFWHGARTRSGRFAQRLDPLFFGRTGSINVWHVVRSSGWSFIRDFTAGRDFTACSSPSLGLEHKPVAMRQRRQLMAVALFWRLAAKKLTCYEIMSRCCTAKGSRSR